MPLAWRKKEQPSESQAQDPPSPVAGSDSPLPSSSEPTKERPLTGAVRFRVESVFTIMGEGCVASGILEKGQIRPPMRLRVEPGPSSSTRPTNVEIIKAVVNRKPRDVVDAGQRAGLTVRGIQGAPILPGSIKRDWDLCQGDFLLLP